ncbi:hypothetical protein [Streptomyces uncialis]|nr:hypothetical protein OG268_36930 [Streptomyces uncialis]
MFSHALIVLIVLAAVGLCVGYAACKKPAVGTAMVTATTVLALLCTLLQS